MMDDLSVKMRWNAPLLMEQLRMVVQSSMPIGVLEGGDMAMSCGEACDKVRQWLSEHLDDVADHGLNDGQYMFVMGNLVGVATLQLKAVQEATVRSEGNTETE